jgi:hypothetical protein
LDSFWVDSISDDAAVLRDVLDHLIESGALHLLPLEVAERVLHEVEEHHALAQLLDEQVLAFCWRRIWKGGREREWLAMMQSRGGEHAIAHGKVGREQEREGKEGKKANC